MDKRILSFVRLEIGRQHSQALGRLEQVKTDMAGVNTAQYNKHIFVVRFKASLPERHIDTEYIENGTIADVMRNACNDFRDRNGSQTIAAEVSVHVQLPSGNKVKIPKRMWMNHFRANKHTENRSHATA